MKMIDRARKLRKVIEDLAVTMDDRKAVENTELFPAWAEDETYELGARVRYNGVLYKCLYTHTTQAQWTPDAAPSLWTKVLIPDPEVIPEWEQPESTNPYMAGDKVRHNDKIWISDVDNNVWEPGVYGWSEVFE